MDILLLVYTIKGMWEVKSVEIFVLEDRKSELWSIRVKSWVNVVGHRILTFLPLY